MQVFSLLHRNQIKRWDTLTFVQAAELDSILLGKNRGSVGVQM